MHRHPYLSEKGTWSFYFFTTRISFNPLIHILSFQITLRCQIDINYVQTHFIFGAFETHFSLPFITFHRNLLTIIPNLSLVLLSPILFIFNMSEPNVDPLVQTETSSFPSTAENESLTNIVASLVDRMNMLTTSITAIQEYIIQGSITGPAQASTPLANITPSALPLESVTFTTQVNQPEPVLSGPSPVHDSSASNTYSNLIGEFLERERSTIELEHSTLQVISREDRSKLNDSDKGKVYYTFSKGIINKFKASNTIVGLGDVSTISNITSFSEQRLELQKHITNITGHTVFLILKFDQNGFLINPDTPEGHPINLLSTNVLPTIDQVEKSTFFHFKRGNRFNQENLTWTYEAVRNSCDKDLQSILDSKMLRYGNLERFGPIYYFELVQQMTSVDAKAVRAITKELTDLKVTDSDGQSIARTVKLIRSTLTWLEMVNMSPPDTASIVYDILETCTVPDFLLFLKTMTTNASLNRSTISTEDLLQKAEEQYRILILTKKWDTYNIGSPSSFQVQRSITNSRQQIRPNSNLPSWHRTAPRDGEPHQKEHEGKTFKWCGTCRRWFFGPRAHITEQHITGFSRNNNQENHTNIVVPSHSQVNQEPQEQGSQELSTSTLRRICFTEGL